LDRGIERAALLDRLHRGVAAEHHLDLLVDDGAYDLVDGGVEPAELGVEIGDLLRRCAQRDADLQVRRLLVVGIGIHLVPGIGHGLDADLLDAVHDRHLEAKSGLRGADDGAVAQQHAALGLIDGVPAPQHKQQNDHAGDGGGSGSSDHRFLLKWKAMRRDAGIHPRPVTKFAVTRVTWSAVPAEWFRRAIRRGFQAVAAVHSSEAPAASMIASMIRRNASGLRCSTKRLAMKAPNIRDEPATRPFSATSAVSAPKRSKVTDLEK